MAGRNLLRIHFNLQKRPGVVFDITRFHIHIVQACDEEQVFPIARALSSGWKQYVLVSCLNGYTAQQQCCCVLDIGTTYASFVYGFGLGRNKVWLDVGDICKLCKTQRLHVLGCGKLISMRFSMHFELGICKTCMVVYTFVSRQHTYMFLMHLGAAKQEAGRRTLIVVL